jgi:hypothetical protein
MSTSSPLRFDRGLSALPTDPKQRHQEFVDFFGQFLFWLRNWSLKASRELVDSEELRSKLGTIRRKPYEGVAEMTPEQRDAALLLTQETLDGFLERFLSCMGDEGTDAKFGEDLAYRFRIEMEIVDVETGELRHQEIINRGGRFFGSYWGRWLNRYGAKAVNNDSTLPASESEQSRS